MTRTGHSYLAEIAVTTSNPDKSAEIANAIAEAYIRDQMDSKLLANQRTESWMKARVDQVKRQADNAVLRVELYRRRSPPLPSATVASRAETSARPNRPRAMTMWRRR